MDSHSRSASPREQPRPQQRPPSPPSPRLPPAAFDNKAYQHDDADPNHNESFTSNGAQQNGHNKELNGESKSLEAVNLELINLTPKNGSLKQKKDVEVDMNGSNPYDEYFVPVNEHRKYMRGEKLYVTADKRGEKGGCKRPLCWTLLALVVAAIIVLIALAATGVIFSNSPTPVDPYNVSISSARALGGIGQSHDDHIHNHEQEQHDHSQEQHDHSHDQNQEQHEHNQEQLDHNPDQSQQQHDSSDDQSQDQHNHTNDQNQEQTHHVQDHNENEHNLDQNQEQPGQVQIQNHDQQENEHSYDENQPQQGQSDLDHEHHEPVLVHEHEHNQSHDQDQGQHEQGLVEDHDQHHQDMNHNDAQADLSQNSNEHDQINQHNPEILMPDTQNDEGRSHTIVPGVNDMSKYVPRTVEGELKIDNEQFLQAYNNPESDEYQQFTEAFKEALTRALFDRNTLEGSDNEIKLKVIQLRPGSVIVTYRINWKPKYEKGPTEDLLNATTLDEKINNYLINNTGMISIYHIAEDDLATRPVLDLCQINKNDCQEGCEFDESSLDFICTCPQGLILDENNQKMCVPSLYYPAPKPVQEISSADTKPTLITTTSEPFNHQIFENNSEIETESTTEAESDSKFSIPFDEHIKNRLDLETTMEHNQQTNEGLESATKQSVDMNTSTMTESIIRPLEVNSTISPIVQNVTNSETYLKDRSASESHEEKVESIPFTIKPELDQVSEEENETRQHIFPNHWDFNPNNVTEVNPVLKTRNNETSSSSYELEPDVHEGHYSDPAFNLDEVLESHQVIKPEEVYTEQPESTSLSNEENESKELSHSIEPETNIMSESNETLVSSEHFNPSTTTASSEDHGSVKIISDENFEKNLPTTTTVNPATITMSQHDFNVIPDISQNPNPDVIINEKDIISDLSETNINANNSKSETNTDDMDDWLTDTLPNITRTIENSHPDTISFSENPSESKNDTESRSFKSSINDPETTPTSANNDILDMNTLSNIPSTVGNITIDKTNETKDYKTSAVATTDDVNFDRSVPDKNDFLNEETNVTNADYDKKHVDYDIPSIISQPKVPILHKMNPSEQEITTEVSENSPKIMNKTTDSFDDAKFITFDDINMLLNRSSKSMDNLTENMDSKESLKTTANGTVDLEDSPSKQNNSEWISESVTEGKYNDEVYTMDKTESSESVKNKVDHIMTHAKDDYEPDYLSKADDSIYMMERDYDSEDPRVKRVNTENKDVTITELPKENKTETNSIFYTTITNTSEQISTDSPPAVVINVVTSTTSVPSTTVSEFIYNNAEKNINDLYETSAETTTSLNKSSTSQIPETGSILKEFNNDSNSETILSTINETSLGPVNATSTVFSPHAENDDTFNNTEVSNKNIVNETQAGNLDVTIYEISHHTGNHSLPVSNSSNTQMLEYEDHETEMNPFLPETENNKNLVKKLQEGHDFELTNMNETQNENSDEHNFNSTEGHLINNIVNDEASTITPHANEQVNMTPTDHKELSETPSDNKTSVENLDKSESSVSNKIIQEDKDNNIETGKEVLPISTFLIDTDDLDANKISSRFGVSNNENLSVVPITKDIEEENVPPENSKTHSRYELNDISDTLKNSEKRTFEFANYEPFTNN